jgi:hypothetical protein
MKLRLFLLSLLLTLVLSHRSIAHPIDDNSITVVLHEQHSVSLVLRLDFAGLLQRLLAPMSAAEEFLLAAATADEASLDKAYTQLQDTVQQQLALGSRGTPLPLQHWVWPALTVVHDSIRQRLAAELVGAEAQAFDSALEVRAEAVDVLAIERLTLTLPDLLQPAILLWYPPRQRLLSPDNSSTVLEF